MHPLITAQIELDRLYKRRPPKWNQLAYKNWLKKYREAENWFRELYLLARSLVGPSCLILPPLAALPGQYLWSALPLQRFLI